MSRSGVDPHEELSVASSSSLRNLLSIVTEFVKLFDGCEALIQPIPHVGARAGSCSERRERVRAHDNILPFGGVPRKRRSVRSQSGRVA